MNYRLRSGFYALLRHSERYTKTDMVYLARGSFWLITGQAGGALLSLSVAIAFGHLALPDTYGNYKYVLSLAGLFGAFSLSGIGTAVTQATARGHDGSLRQGLSLAVKWSWGIVLLSLAAAAYYALIKHNAFLGISLVIVAIATPLLNGFSLFDPFLIGKKQFARDTIYNFLNALFPVAAVIATLFITHRAIVVIVVYFSMNALSDALFYFLTLRGLQTGSHDPELFSYSGHLSVMGIINAIADKIDSIVIFILLGPVQLAVYAFAIAIPEQIKSLTRIVAPLALPRFAERSIGEIRQNIWQRAWILTFAVAVIVLVYIAVAPWLFGWLFPIYTGSVWYSRIYALSIICNGFVVLFLTVFQAHKRTKDLYIVSNIGSVLLIVMLPILTYEFGIMGSIVSQIVFRFSGVILAAWRFSRIRE